MTGAQRIRKGEYSYRDSWIVKTPKGWELRSEVTGEVYEIFKTLREAKREIDYIKKCDEDRSAFEEW